MFEMRKVDMLASLFLKQYGCYDILEDEEKGK